MENITVNVFDDVLYLAWEFVYLIFFTRFVCVHGNYTVSYTHLTLPTN